MNVSLHLTNPVSTKLKMTRHAFQRNERLQRGEGQGAERQCTMRWTTRRAPGHYVVDNAASNSCLGPTLSVVTTAAQGWRIFLATSGMASRKAGLGTTQKSCAVQEGH